MDQVTNRIQARFKKAVAALERAFTLGELPDHAERDATLLRFELAAELMPKTLQRILAEKGSDVVLPKDVVRAATGANIIDEQTGTVLLKIIDDRNRMVHDYSEEYANELYVRIHDMYLASLTAMEARIES